MADTLPPSAPLARLYGACGVSDGLSLRRPAAVPSAVIGGNSLGVSDGAAGCPDAGRTADAATCLPITHKSKIEYVSGCPNSRFSLVGRSDDGGTLIVAAGCKRGCCPYCGRLKSYQFMRRVSDRLARDTASGVESVTRTLFVTFTLRARAGVSVAESFRIVHKAAAYAYAAVRRPRKGGRSWRGVRGVHWQGLDLNYSDSVDVQPGTGMAHIHALVRVRALPGRTLPTDKAIRSRLSQAFNHHVYKLTGRKQLPYYAGGLAVGYVHADKSTNSSAATRYMALHNGKIWRGEWAYPNRYRRLATSRGFLSAPEPSAGGWQHVKKSLSAIAASLAHAGIPSAAVLDRRGRVSPSSVTVALSLSAKAILRHVFGYAGVTTPRADAAETCAAAEAALGAAAYGVSAAEWRVYRAGGADALLAYGAAWRRFG